MMDSQWVLKLFYFFFKNTSLTKKTFSGIAYILKLLDQFKEFDSLHWFDEIATKYLKEQKSLQSQLNDNKQKEDHQTILLNLKKSKMYQMEFELLRYSFDGARVFFKYERDVISKGEGDKARQNEASNSNSTQEEQKPQDPSTNGETTISSMDGFSSAPPPPPPITSIPYRVLISPLQTIRPYITMVIMRDVTFTPELFQTFIDLQTSMNFSI